MNGLKTKPSGVARQLVTFLVLPRKVTKRSRPRFAAPAGSPRKSANKRGCATRPSGAHTPCPAAELEQCSPKPPLVCSLSRRRAGEKIQKPSPKTSEAGQSPPRQEKQSCAQSAHKTAFDFPSPVRRRVAQNGREQSD